MGRPKGTIEKVRLNLELHPEVKEELLALQNLTLADSQAEVIRRAIKMYGHYQRNKHLKWTVDGKETVFL